MSDRRFFINGRLVTEPSPLTAEFAPAEAAPAEVAPAEAASAETGEDIGHWLARLVGLTVPTTSGERQQPITDCSHAHTVDPDSLPVQTCCKEDHCAHRGNDHSTHMEGGHNDHGNGRGRSDVHSHGHGHGDGHGKGDGEGHGCGHGHGHGCDGHGHVCGHGGDHGHGHGHNDGHGHGHGHVEGHAHQAHAHNDEGNSCDSDSSSDHSHGHGHDVKAASHADPQLQNDKVIPVVRTCTACCDCPSPEICKEKGCVPCEMVKTRLMVRNICCEAEVRLIDKIVSPLHGVEGVSTNVFTKMAIVGHCPVECCAPVEIILNKLNDARLGASLLTSNTSDAKSPKSLLEHLRANIDKMHCLVTWCVFLVGMLLEYVIDTDHDQDMQEDGHEWPLSAGDWCLIIATFMGMLPILYQAFFSLKKCHIDMKVLMSFAIGGALGAAEYHEAALLVVLFVSAELVEHAAMARVERALNTVMQLSETRTAMRVQDGKQVPVSELQVNDEICLRPGDECPIDGVVARGSAAVSEAAMTGEAMPIEKKKGNQVISGCVLLNGYIEVKLTVSQSDSTLEKVKNQVEEAQMSKGRAQMLIDQFAKFWTPAILLVVLVLLIPMPLATGDPFKEWLDRALVMLVLACPCALVLAAPIPTTCAIAAAARRSVLIKRADVVERLASVQVTGLDKTGTLTCGEFGVVAVENISAEEGNPQEEEAWLKFAAALESRSAHPVAAAIVSRATGCVVDSFETGGLPKIKKFKNLAGIGVQGEVFDSNGSPVAVVAGNRKALDLVRASSDAWAAFNSFQKRHRNDTVIVVIINGALKLGIALNDTVRPDAKAAVLQLRALGCNVTMLTGDTASAARPVGDLLNIEDRLCSLLPTDKLAWIKDETAKKKRTLMLGDGINDSSALAAATVGVAMGEGSMALAARTADVVIMSDKLSLLPRSISVCKYAKRLVLFNISFAAIVKLGAIILALNDKLQLWMAVLVDVGSLLVVLLVGVTVLSKSWGNDDDLVRTDHSKAKFQSTAEV